MIDLLLRAIAVGSLLATMAATLRTGSPTAPVWTFRLFCLGIIGILVFGSEEISAVIGPFRHLARVLSAGGIAFFWLFGLAMFSREPLRPLHAVPILTMTALAVPEELLRPAVVVASKNIYNIYNMVEVLLVGHVLIEIRRSWTDDLVSARRALRIPFMVTIGGTCLALTGLKFAALLGFPYRWLMNAQAAVTMSMALAGAAAFAQERTRLFERAMTKRSGNDSSTPEAAAADRAAMHRLRQLMGDSSFWRRPGLTIGGTADRLQVPEYRLRQLINRQLGYRNFSEFLNERRIAVAKEELTDPDKARVQISTIAFDLGYASLGPFNRAFRETTGMSPREWRGRFLNCEKRVADFCESRPSSN